MNRAKGLRFWCVGPALFVIGSSGCGRTHSVSPVESASGAASAGARSGPHAGGNGGIGGATNLAGAAALGVAGATVGPANGCPGAKVKCLDAVTAQYCDDQNQLIAVECKVGMPSEGFVSTACEANAQGDGCTVDAFLDPDCQAGTPPFTACLGGTVEDLLDVYAACFTDLHGAQAIISCYSDFIDYRGTLVDCDAAQAACLKL